MSRALLRKTISTKEKNHRKCNFNFDEKMSISDVNNIRPHFLTQLPGPVMTHARHFGLTGA